MTVAEILPEVRYVTDNKGEKTDVLVPFSTWQALLTAWDLLIAKLEEQEDRAVVQEWLEERRQGVTKTISLDELEHELIIDGLLPSSNQ
ncbi:MAG: hypothetical protein DYG89_26660 [Caldilinea sp. CFX5]|nr:hypothetical protein [Caldilinea sp. CFX5]